jgi:catalase (peroxidase I)
MAKKIKNKKIKFKALGSGRTTPKGHEVVSTGLEVVWPPHDKKNKDKYFFSRVLAMGSGQTTPKGQNCLKKI